MTDRLRYTEYSPTTPSAEKPEASLSKNLVNCFESRSGIPTKEIERRLKDVVPLFDLPLPEAASKLITGDKADARVEKFREGYEFGLTMPPRRFNIHPDKKHAVLMEQWINLLQHHGLEEFNATGSTEFLDAVTFDPVLDVRKGQKKFEEPIGDIGQYTGWNDHFYDLKDVATSLVDLQQAAQAIIRDGKYAICRQLVFWDSAEAKKVADENLHLPVLLHRSGKIDLKNKTLLDLAEHTSVAEDVADETRTSPLESWDYYMPGKFRITYGSSKPNGVILLLSEVDPKKVIWGKDVYSSCMPHPEQFDGTFFYTLSPNGDKSYHPSNTRISTFAKQGFEGGIINLDEYEATTFSERPNKGVFYLTAKERDMF